MGGSIHMLRTGSPTFRWTMPTARAPNAKRAPRRTQNPSEIAPGVYVGGWKDAPRFQGARFCVLDEAPPDMPPATHIPIYREADETARVDHLDRLAADMHRVRNRGRPVLVFCGHGIRRSALGGVWYLRRAEGLSLDQAYDRVRSVRPKVQHAREWVRNAEELARA